MDPSRYRRLLSLTLQNAPASAALPAPLPSPHAISEPSTEPAVEITVDGSPERYALRTERPFLIVGSSKRCDVRLPAEGVAPQHAYLQLFQGGVHCVNLTQPAANGGEANRRHAGWMRPDRPIYVGPYTLRCRSTAVDPDAASLHVENLVSPAGHYLYESRPAELIPLNARTGETSAAWRIRQPITLIGRSNLCRPQLDHPSVERMHCSIAAMPDALYLIDLRSGAGTWVNDRRKRFRRLRQDDVIRIGNFQMTVNYPGVADERQPSSTSWTLDESPARAANPQTGDAGSDNDLLQQVLRMQQDTFSKSHQQTMLLAQLLGESHRNYHEVVKHEMEKIGRLDEQIAEIRQELLDATQRSLPGPASSTADGPANNVGRPAIESGSPESVPAAHLNAEPRPRSTRDDCDRHANLVEKMGQLERERTGRMKRVIQVLCGIAH